MAGFLGVPWMGQFFGVKGGALRILDPPKWKGE